MFNDSFLMLGQALPAAGGNVFFTTYRLNIETAKTGLRCQIELLKFFTHRIQLYQIFLVDLAESIELNDTLEVVADFTQNALVEGARESARLAGITSKMGSASAKVARELADDTVSDIATRTCV